MTGRNGSAVNVAEMANRKGEVAVWIVTRSDLILSWTYLENLLNASFPNVLSEPSPRAHVLRGGTLTPMRLAAALLALPALLAAIDQSSIRTHTLSNGMKIIIEEDRD